MAATLYETVKAKRKQWTPIQPQNKEQAVEGTEDLLSRCVSLRFLELPVKSFILDGLSRKESSAIGEEGREALIRNTQDEERHDQALNNCVAVFSNYNNRYEQQMATIIEAWVNHPDNPITKAAVLENGVFFLILPLLRRFGGEALRVTSVDISADEINHVQTHRYASKQMGCKPSKSLDTLRKQTVDWVIGDFKSYEDVTASMLRNASDKLMYKGIAPELSFTMSYQVPAFFERRNDTLPYYN